MADTNRATAVAADPARPEPASAPLAYRVLARTHRPARLSELVGQDALVRSLTHAVQTGRIAHAFLLTGIRGVGKTTTARIIARALNCIGPDGEGGPTPEPCGVCAHCRQIAEDRHIDVLEMDAATRTGIDDIREIVESVRYAPTSARFKVYIIDEVHMLSEKAFNGLLKTLEEPPPQAKFIFATTEVRKVPVTILSRCQRFDLRRVGPDLLVGHLSRIAGIEGIEIAPDALLALVRAAGGSVRDALSLLDQAIALREQERAIDLAQVHGMLGLADHGRIIDLFELLMRGEVGAALGALDELYALGSEPEVILGELLEICHWLTRLRTAPDPDTAPVGGEMFQARGEALAAGLSLAVLARTWQMLLKGLDELRLAPDSLRAAEMVLIRIAYAADLPPPGALAGGAEPAPAPAVGAALPATAGAASAATMAPPAAAVPRPSEPAPEAAPAPEAGLEAPGDFAAAVRLFRERGQPLLGSWLEQQAALVAFRPGEIEVRIDGPSPPDWPGRAAQLLTVWTGRPWVITLSDRPGEPPLAVQAAARKEERILALATDPRLRPVLDAYPGARIVDVRAGAGDAPASEAAE